MTTRRPIAAPQLRVALPALVATLCVCAFAPARGAAATWHDVASPNDGAYNTLRAVSSATSADAWAVGVAFGARSHAPIAEHWTGTAWTGFTPPFGGDGGALTSVVDVTAGDASAVGYSVDGSGQSSALIEHWNGSAWTSEAPPQARGYHSALSGVAAVSPAVRWAVGDKAKAGGKRETYAIVRSGGTWTAVATPNVKGESGQLLGVAGTSAHDVWAVGYTQRGSAGASHVLIEHFDGVHWSIVPAAGVRGAHAQLRAVYAVAANDVWAVGYSAATANAQALVEHFDGRTWSLVASPAVAGSGLLSVSGSAANDVWAVGSRADGDGYAALAEHWNGARWTLVKTIDRSNGGGDQLSGVAAVPGTTDFWAVGGTFDVGGNWTATVAQRFTRSAGGAPHTVVPRPNI